MKARRLLISLIVLMSICICTAAAAAQQKKLAKNEELYPRGWSVGDQVKFRGGTTVLLDEQGAVISGILSNDMYLRPHGWERIVDDYHFVSVVSGRDVFFPYFYRYRLSSGAYNMAIPNYGHLRYKGGAKVEFSEQGTVISGVIADSATFGIGKDRYGFITFKSKSLIEFYEDGTVSRGTLKDDTKLKPVGWERNYVDNAGFAECKEKTEVWLSPEGEILSCTLKKPLQWKNRGQVIELPANKKISFSLDGAEE